MILDQQLRALETAELIRIAAAQPEVSYLFRHALVQDAAYLSILRADRRALHRLVGAVLEQTYPLRLDELAPLLGAHYAEAGDVTRALHYYRRAGDRAMQRYANGEAVLHYTRALALAPEGECATPDWQHLFVKRGRALELSGRFQDALTNYIDMQLFAHERGEHAMEIAALTARATLHSTETPLHDPSQAELLSLQTLELARERGDQAAEARILWNLMLLHVFGGGGASQARPYGEQSLALARAFDLREQLALTLKDLFYVYWLLGDLQSARHVRLEALSLARALDDRTMVAECLLGLGVVAFLQAEHDQADAYMAQADALSASINDAWGQAAARATRGYVYAERGEVDRALGVWADSARLAGEARTFSGLLITNTELARTYAMLGARDEALVLARQAVTLAQTHLPSWGGWAQATLARILLLQGDSEAAAKIVVACCAGPKRAYFERMYPLGAGIMALADAELAFHRRDYLRAEAIVDDALEPVRGGAPNLLSELEQLKAQALWARAQHDAAYALLQEARRHAEGFQSRRALLLILPLLTQWAKARGDAAAVQQARAQARDVTSFVAEHISDPALRACFQASQAATMALA